ncbi:PepSY-associated TM helix domain-containing protein [Paraburkholderia sp. CNPSo 3076]|uniref:PepSY-associated TM helix domain-containing protein n=1 Tax=Paraburkholderia sp. CNPSo 3076 TaxID=2940936 RepID=UPI00224F6A4B|nr:PepSY-associated TM helix domain-containing protein [Paraburkholderia sp. CNPSo 3076]MCX5539006.1 PepSY-associated TM helix domain-containing protein [Paraburkholderia sp. CNPSo 3076]
MSFSDTAEIDAPVTPRTRLYAEQRDERAKRSRRATFIKWLRKVHGWVGLWGAALGLLFGATGFVLNHRAEPLRISPGAPQVSTVQIAVPDPAPETPREMVKWLRAQPDLKLPARTGRVQKEPKHNVAWGDRQVVQPEHWQMMFTSPGESVMVEYWVGNDKLTLKRNDNSLVSTITNLHKGTGMSVGWVLFIDGFAGALILLSLTGVLLWTELNKRKTVGAVLLFGSIIVAVCVGLA